MERVKRGSGKQAMVVAVVLIALAAAFGAGYGLSSLARPSLAPGVTVIDDLGRVVTVPGEVRRIISLAPSATEILFAIGLGPSVVAVDSNSDYPPELQTSGLPRLDTYPSVDLEAILVLRPDLVLAADINPLSDVERIASKGLAVIVLAPRTIEGVLRDIVLVGLVTGSLSAAKSTVSSLRARVDAVLAVTSNTTLVPHRPLVYLEFFPLWTFGPGSFGHDLIIMAGGRNVGANLTASFAQVSNEFIISADPEVIVFTVGPYTQTTADEIRSREGWGGIRAVQGNKIYTIDDNEASRPGPRIVDALEDLAAILHPSLFT